MTFLDVGRMRTIDWNTSIDWDVRFPEAPPPFDQWFPATDVEENLATLNNKDYQFYMSSYEFPQMSAIFDLQITFIDDVVNTVHQWIAKWINEDILNNGRHLTPLADAVRTCHLVRTDGTGRIIRQAAYLVTPDGSINWQGASGPAIMTNSMRFPIAGSAEVPARD